VFSFGSIGNHVAPIISREQPVPVVHSLRPSAAQRRHRRSAQRAERASQPRRRTNGCTGRGAHIRSLIIRGRCAAPVNLDLARSRPDETTQSEQSVTCHGRWRRHAAPAGRFVAMALL